MNRFRLLRPLHTLGEEKIRHNAGEKTGSKSLVFKFHYSEHGLTNWNYRANKSLMSSLQSWFGRIYLEQVMLPTNIDDGTDKNTGTLGKAVAVLEAVALSDKSLRFTDLLSIVPQPRGTLHRQVSNLIDEGFLSVNVDQTYQLGVRFLKFAARSWSKNRFREVAEPFIHLLHDATGETVHLGVLAGAEVVYVDKVESRQVVRMHSQIGNASPSYCTGVGKVALSTFSDAQVRQKLERVKFKIFTDTTHSSLEALLAELGVIRSHGFGFDRQEHEPGIHCVAAPIRSLQGNIAAGISVTAPTFRVSMGQLEEWAALVCQTAASIEAEINARLSPRS